MIEERIKQLIERYNEVSKKLSDPNVVSDPEEYRKIAKEHKNLSPIVEKGTEYLKTLSQLQEDREILREGDPELKAIVKEEIEELEEKEKQLQEELKIMLLPKDPNDDKNAVVEIRAGTGGEEAAIFAADLFRMYSKYAEKKGWKLEVLSSNETGIGGYKEIIFSLSGNSVYGTMKFESGVHRVQRVPITETSGRIHTSAASVAVLPEAEEIDVEIDPNDLRIDTYRASGHGGQHVNKVETAIRITHIPTGIVVTCQDEKSQYRNKMKAMKILRTRLLSLKQAEKEAELAEKRRSMISTGDRSVKIRTYNFPQGRVTDHRINLTLYKLNEILDGELDELIDALRVAYTNEQLQQAGTTAQS